MARILIACEENQTTTKAFRELRKYGYIAKQNFWCCQSCAWADLTDKEAEKAVVKSIE